MKFVLTYDDGQALLRGAGACLISGKLFLPEQIGIAIKEQHLGPADGDPKFRTERLVRYVGRQYFSVNEENYAEVSGAVCRKFRSLSFEDEQNVLLQMMTEGAKAREFQKVIYCPFVGIDVCDQTTRCSDYAGHAFRGRFDHCDRNGRKLKPR